ncbi:MAG: EboA domain-containing protein [Cyclobacteriaceae bacterium]|nr:EboA domain-containing protein [Cyclobacteriaceae bacterium]
MNDQVLVDLTKVCDFLHELLGRQLSKDSKDWLQQKLKESKSAPSTKQLYLFFGTAPRFIPKTPLILTPEDTRRAHELREGWHLEGWTTLQLARILAVLSYPYVDHRDFTKIVEQLFTTAEMLELVALYSALPLYPYPESMLLRAAEGIRTNMTVVFDAVALRNPFPHDFLSEGAWNQMVLKALFMERPLHQVWGIDQRSNAPLAKMISNFAHERWAAGRSTSPEMWRPIKGQHVTLVLEDLRHLFTLDDPLQHTAAVLTCRDLDNPECRDVLSDFQTKVEQVDLANWSWESLGQYYWRLKDIPAN